MAENPMHDEGFVIAKARFQVGSGEMQVDIDLYARLIPQDRQPLFCNRITDQDAHIVCLSTRPHGVLSPPARRSSR